MKRGVRTYGVQRGEHYGRPHAGRQYRSHPLPDIRGGLMGSDGGELQGSMWFIAEL